jgi:peptidoglycan/LPS O-acetylase OafA/YrhL
MQFYFVFPLLFVILRRFDFAKPAALIGFTTFVLGLFFSRHVHFNEPSLLLLKLNYFIAGIVLHRFLSGDLNKVQGAATGLLAVALVSVDYRYGLGLLILPVLLTLMLVLGRLELEGKTPKWLSALIESRVVQFASDTSYSVYLFHGFFIAAAGYIVAGHESFINAQPRLSSWLMYGFVLVFTYVAANAAYRFVELPSIRLGKRVIERTLPRARADSGTPRGPEASSSTQAAKS